MSSNNYPSENTHSDKSSAIQTPYLERIASRIFPESLETPDQLERKYPRRELSEGAIVTRVSPSPTGFMHIGTLYTALLSERFAHQAGGVFFLRIEDTDKKREVKGAADFILHSLAHFKIRIDEGRTTSGAELGLYGPYTQSARKSIYHSYVRYLLQKGKAYLCFCTPEELNNIRAEQERRKIRPGYYGEWARWRNKPHEHVHSMIEAGHSYVIRLKSTGNNEHKITFDDLILGERSLPENDQDIVILKSDGLPTYHFAHVVDDHLMRTTLVIRGDEWIPSLSAHVELWQTFGWDVPAYAHIAPINKMDKSSKRKLSKRKDPEASIGYFDEEGYPSDALIEYLLTLANSNYEDWRRDHPDSDNRQFRLTFERLRNSNGPLFDFKKLDNISRDVVGRLSAEEIYSQAFAWARQHETALACLLERYVDYAKRIFSIERGRSQPRKDIGRWKEIGKEFNYFFDERFHLTASDAEQLIGGFTLAEIRQIAREFLGSYCPADTKDVWFTKMKIIARAHGFAETTAAFKNNPTAFRGSMADLAKILRVLLTGRTQTPELYEIIQVLGTDRLIKRLSI